MISHLPRYVVQTESDVYSSLPDFVSLSKDIEEIPIREKEEQLCLICMSELSVGNIQTFLCLEFGVPSMRTCQS